MATPSGISDSPNRPKLAVTLRFTADVFPSVLFDLILEVLPFIERVTPDRCRADLTWPNLLELLSGTHDNPCVC
jgi:hypothetical protein